MTRLFDMTDAQIDRAVEAHWDAEWERLNAPDAWEHDEPGNEEMAALVDTYYTESQIADLVRDYLNGNTDAMLKLYEGGHLAGYIDPAKQMKDPDEVWAEVDRVFTAEWKNDELMLTIWEVDAVCEAICDGLVRSADNDPYDYLREKYNNERRDY